MGKFRYDAKQSLERARVEIASGDKNRLRYAALELRMALEALTYDRAEAYKNEMPPKEYNTWQPKKLMAVLQEIDPDVDQPKVLTIGDDDSSQFTGYDNALSIATLKRHYDALGSFLHMPTQSQYSSDDDEDLVDFEKLKKRCEDIAEAVDKVLTSNFWNIWFGHSVKHECHDCGEIIRRRFHMNSKKIAVHCFNCPASYEVEIHDNKTCTWTELVTEIKCPNPDCSETRFLWNRQIRAGINFVCNGCGKQNLIRLAVALG